MATKVVTGSRSKIYVNNQLVGVYDSCTYNSNIGVEPIHILGKFSADEITPTSYEPVTLSCTGFRVVGAGPYAASSTIKYPTGATGEAGTASGGPGVSSLQDLINLDGVTITVVDRQTGLTILTAVGCVATSFSGNFNAKATSKITVNYTGLVLSDESSPQSESAGATQLP